MPDMINGFTEEEIRSYNARDAVYGVSLMPEEAMDSFLHTDIPSMPQDIREDFDRLSRALGGDFAAAAQLSPMMRDFYVTTMMRELVGNPPHLDVDSPDTRNWLKSNAMDPWLQSGMELMKEQHPELRTELGAAIGYLNQHVMEQTLRPVTPEQIRRMKRTIPEDPVGIPVETLEEIRAGADRDRLADKQSSMAAMLLMGHVGGVELQGGNSELHQNSATMTEIFAHGGRVGFSLPTGDGKRFFRTLTYDREGKDLTMFRAASTHDMVPAVRNGKGKRVRGFQESKGTTFRHNRGMNVPIGGFGNPFGDAPDPASRLIDHHGEDGHMFMKMLPSTEKENGGLLIGIEGEEPHKTGRTGKVHGMEAKSAVTSSFGATKHGLGLKTGGRHVDLTGVNMDDLHTLVRDFRAQYSRLQSLDTEDSRQRLDIINKMLAGHQMEPRNMLRMCHLMTRDLENTRTREDMMSNALRVMEQARNHKMEQIDLAQIDSQDLSLDRLERTDLEFLRTTESLNIKDPRLDFFMDRLDGIKKGKKDPEMKEVNKRLDACMAADLHGDRARYQEELRALHKACEDYAKKIDPEKVGDRMQVVLNLMSVTDDVLEKNAQLLQREQEEKAARQRDAVPQNPQEQEPKEAEIPAPDQAAEFLSEDDRMSIPREKRNLLYGGSREELQAFLNEQKEDSPLSPKARAHFERRLKAEEAFAAQKAKIQKDGLHLRGAVFTQRESDEKSSLEPRVDLPGINALRPMTSSNGCWSVAMEALLMSRGVSLTQEQIRMFRSAKTEEQARKEGESRSYLYSNREQDIGDKADLVNELLPDTVMKSATVIPRGTDPERKEKFWQLGSRDQEYVIEETRKIIYEALTLDHSPLAVTDGHHYQVITGMEGDSVWVRDTNLQHQGLTEDEFGQARKVPIRELLEGSPVKDGKNPNFAGDQVSFTWLRPLERELSDPGARGRYQVGENGEIRINSLKPGKEAIEEGSNWNSHHQGIHMRGADITTTTWMPKTRTNVPVIQEEDSLVSPSDKKEEKPEIRLQDPKKVLEEQGPGNEQKREDPFTIEALKKEPISPEKIRPNNHSQAEYSEMIERMFPKQNINAQTATKVEDAFQNVMNYCAPGLLKEAKDANMDIFDLVQVDGVSFNQKFGKETPELTKKLFLIDYIQNRNATVNAENSGNIKTEFNNKELNDLEKMQELKTYREEEKKKAEAKAASEEALQEDPNAKKDGEASKEEDTKTDKKEEAREEDLKKSGDPEAEKEKIREEEQKKASEKKTEEEKKKEEKKEEEKKEDVSHAKEDRQKSDEAKKTEQAPDKKTDKFGRKRIDMGELQDRVNRGRAKSVDHKPETGLGTEKLHSDLTTEATVSEEQPTEKLRNPLMEQSGNHKRSMAPKKNGKKK